MSKTSKRGASQEPLVKIWKDLSKFEGFSKRHIHACFYTELTKLMTTEQNRINRCFCRNNIHNQDLNLF